MKRKLSVIAAAVMVFSGLAFAQESADGPVGATAPPTVMKITPDEAVDLAIKNNLSLQSTAVDLDTKKRQSDLRWNQFIPSFDARVTLGRQNQGSTVSGNTPVIQAPLNTALGLPAGSPPVYGVTPYSMDVDPQWFFQTNFAIAWQFSFALFEGIRNLRLNYETGLISYEKAKLQTERDIRKAYYQMLLAQENLKLTRESYETAERQETSARAAYRAGLAPELQLLQAQVSKENKKPELDEQENQVKMLKAQFAYTLGLPTNTDFELIQPRVDSIDAVPLDTRQLIADAVEKKPDIKELKAQIVYAKSGRKAQDLRQNTPYIALSWNFAPNVVDPWTPGNWGDWFKKDGGSFSLTVGMNLNGLVPLFKEGQALKDLDNQIKIAEIGLEQMKQGTEIEVYNIILSLQKAQTSIEALKKTVELAQRSYDSTYRAYGAGLQTFVEVKNAEDALNQAKLGVLSQNYTYIMGLIDLEYAVGVSLGTLSRSETGNED
ncbi:MAG: TolC family protein [Treponema sp.]|nr:TolC family protein [Treponema sp.]